jgi:L-lactate dehydrogenase complex protein LldG
MQSERVREFIASAAAVSTTVTEADSVEAALAVAVELCVTKQACQPLMAGCGEPLSPPADALCGVKPHARLLAAPELPVEMLAPLERLCGERGIRLITSGLRQHLAGIDIGLTLADYGIAETGTLVLDARSEELRLATMVSEVHVALLPRERIRATAFELKTELTTLLRHQPCCLSFITGASRTADIERVLALGVHGPLALHVVLI